MEDLYRFFALNTSLYDQRLVDILSKALDNGEIALKSRLEAMEVKFAEKEGELTKELESKEEELKKELKAKFKLKKELKAMEVKFAEKEEELKKKLKAMEDKLKEELEAMEVKEEELTEKLKSKEEELKKELKAMEVNLKKELEDKLANNVIANRQTASRQFHLLQELGKKDPALLNFARSILLPDLRETTITNDTSESTSSVVDIASNRSAKTGSRSQKPTPASSSKQSKPSSSNKTSPRNTRSATKSQASSNANPIVPDATAVQPPSIVAKNRSYYEVYLKNGSKKTTECDLIANFADICKDRNIADKPSNATTGELLTWLRSMIDYDPSKNATENGMKDHNAVTKMTKCPCPDYAYQPKTDEVEAYAKVPNDHAMSLFDKGHTPVVLFEFKSTAAHEFIDARKDSITPFEKNIAQLAEYMDACFVLDCEKILPKRLLKTRLTRYGVVISPCNMTFVCLSRKKPNCAPELVYQNVTSQSMHFNVEAFHKLMCMPPDVLLPHLYQSTQYKLGQFIGGGASGRVFAVGPSHVAKLYKEKSDYNTELKTLISLGHQNITGVPRITNSNGACNLLVMTPRGRPYTRTMKPTLNHLKQVFKTLNQVHEAGWIHRDLNTTNLVLVSRNGRLEKKTSNKQTFPTTDDGEGDEEEGDQSNEAENKDDEDQVLIIDWAFAVEENTKDWICGASPLYPNAILEKCASSNAIQETFLDIHDNEMFVKLVCMLHPPQLEVKYKDLRLIKGRGEHYATNLNYWKAVEESSPRWKDALNAARTFPADQFDKFMLDLLTNMNTEAVSLK